MLDNLCVDLEGISLPISPNHGPAKNKCHLFLTHSERIRAVSPKAAQLYLFCESLKIAEMHLPVETNKRPFWIKKKKKPREVELGPEGFFNLLPLSFFKFIIKHFYGWCPLSLLKGIIYHLERLD